MVKVIMHGCNGKMGQVISGLIAADPDMELVAGIDARDDGHNPYPVFTDITKCDVAADAIIDFSAAVAVDRLLNYCVEKKIPCVLCTTGLSEAQLSKVDEAAKHVAILKSANMSLGINLMLKLLKEAAGVLANAGFDMEIVEKHHNLKVDAPSGTAYNNGICAVCDLEFDQFTKFLIVNRSVFVHGCYDCHACSFKNSHMFPPFTKRQRTMAPALIIQAYLIAPHLLTR